MEDSKAAENFKPFLVKSLILHIGLFAAFSMKAKFFPSEAINLESAIRVDVVALPDKLPAIPQPKPVEKAPPKKVEAAPKPAPKPKPKVKDKVNLNAKRKENLNKAIDRARALQKIEDLLKEEEQKEVAQEIKGNEISKGSQLTGVKRLQYDDYLARLESHVKSFWSIPAWMANLDLRAEVTVRISPEGYVISKRISKSSGDKNYDDQVLATIDRASPFPRPSDKFKTILSNEGFRLGFPE